MNEVKAAAAVDRARERRVARAVKTELRVKWFIEQVHTKIKMTLKARVRLATNFVRDRVVINLSKPVRKYSVFSKKTGSIRVVVDPNSRSKSGEFPRADTTQLMKSIFAEMKEVGDGVFEGYVGTPLDYGLILETRMDRSFLVRTFNEELSKVRKIITGPIK